MEDRKKFRIWAAITFAMAAFYLYPLLLWLRGWGMHLRAYGGYGHTIPLSADIFGLMPVMLSAGVGADVMKRIAAPLIGGLISSTVLTLIVIPAIYTIWMEREGKLR